jgi:hypothetical protein
MAASSGERARVRGFDFTFSPSIGLSANFPRNGETGKSLNDASGSVLLVDLKTPRCE